jgi:hypothetical protein
MGAISLGGALVLVGRAGVCGWYVVQLAAQRLRHTLTDEGGPAQQ